MQMRIMLLIVEGEAHKLPVDWQQRGFLIQLIQEFWELEVMGGEMEEEVVVVAFTEVEVAILMVVEVEAATM